MFLIQFAMRNESTVTRYKASITNNRAQKSKDVMNVHSINGGLMT